MFLGLVTVWHYILLFAVTPVKLLPGMKSPPRCRQWVPRARAWTEHGGACRLRLRGGVPRHPLCPGHLPPQEPSPTGTCRDFGGAIRGRGHPSESPETVPDSVTELLVPCEKPSMVAGPWSLAG